MRDQLAEELLARVMKWDTSDVTRERPVLQALASLKYDEYQQFSPGMRFIESLALWLNQFSNKEERKAAYEFIRCRLVFISNAELNHLVSIAFSDFIRPFLINLVAQKGGISDSHIMKIVNGMDYKILLRQTLFLGLSDGARMDLFRRCNQEISHEQVWQAYEIPKEKGADMRDELKKSLMGKEYLNREPTIEECRFKVIVLLDDFSGSGLSYLRPDSQSDNNFAGKINKILNHLNKSDFKDIVDISNLQLYILLYVSTTKALSYLKEQMDVYLGENSNSVKVYIQSIQELPEDIRINLPQDDPLIRLFETYFDNAIVNKDYRKGKIDHPYLGFDECALPLILSHNSPNNSLPLLWFEDHRKYRGLFPRVSRHRRD